MEYGCIGEKLSHSFSKTIHNELTDYEYVLKEIERENLADFMNKADFKAINVTIPYKQAVIPFLDYVDDVSKKIGAVNTVVNRNGKLYGYNTDFFGMTALVKRANISLEGKKVLILGSGGTSKTAFAVAQSLNASEIYRVSRKSTQDTITYEEMYENHLDAKVIINTTPCGMFPNNDSAAVDLVRFTNLSGVVDAVYNPIDSLLVTTAKKRGINAVGGLFMLVSQAVFAAEKFVSISIENAKTEEVYKKLLLEKKNLVLIGMPSCGKTTIGRELAVSLSKEFIDTDDEIVKKVGMSISLIFEKYGEEYFRKLESQVIAEISLKQNCVIATGGGAVLNSKNTDLLKGNSSLIFIDRPLEKLIATSDRPLSNNAELLKKRYNERYGIYCDVADKIFKAKDDLNENIKLIKEGFLNEILSS